MLSSGLHPADVTGASGSVGPARIRHTIRMGEKQSASSFEEQQKGSVSGHVNRKRFRIESTTTTNYLIIIV